jgi:inosine-uridine nucleoside N-ribohydrolase
LYRDGLADITNRHPELAIRNPPTPETQTFYNLTLSNESAVEVTLGLIAARGEREITYIALGPLTNFTNTFRTDSKLVSRKLGRFVCMGGTFEAPGNTTPVAECEFSRSVGHADFGNW